MPVSQLPRVVDAAWLADHLGDEDLVVGDVRGPNAHMRGHIPGARRVEVGTLFAAPGRPQPPERIRELVGAPEGAEVVAYCHSGSRSALAALALRAAGYEARNYPGSWHEWSRHDDLPMER